MGWYAVPILMIVMGGFIYLSIKIDPKDIGINTKFSDKDEENEN